MSVTILNPIAEGGVQLPFYSFKVPAGFPSEGVKLVFFNTCFSFNQAQSCVENVNAAIGMNREIGDEGARVFSSQFYSGIGFGDSIPKAFAQIKPAPMMEDLSQADIPELHLKEGLLEEELTLVRPRRI